MLEKYAVVPPGEQTPGDWLVLSLVLAGSVECCKTLSLLNILPGSCREREREREREQCSAAVTLTVWLYLNIGQPSFIISLSLLLLKHTIKYTTNYTKHDIAGSDLKSYII